MRRALVAGWGAITLLLGVVPAVAQTPYQPTVRPVPGDTLCGTPICGAQFLAPAFLGLDAADSGPVHILVIGDSHTAGDQITGRLRSRFQARLGRGGRGVIPPGIPYDSYAPRQFSLRSYRVPYERAPLVATGATRPVGLAGGQGRLPPFSGRLLVQPEPEAPVTRLGLCGQAGPDRGGVLILATGGLVTSVDFHQDQPGPVCHSVALPMNSGDLFLSATGQSVVLDDIRLFDDQGLSVSNLGVIGSTLYDFASRDPSTVEAQLKADPPSLIVLAFGTNEGFDDGLDPAAYERTLRERIIWLRQVVPGAAILILGPPDGQRRPRSASGPQPWSPSCGDSGDWQTPPGLALVRDVQRRVSEEMNVAFWDWYGRMGGSCSAFRLAGGSEPLMHPDRVHFTAIGAEWIGDILADDLLNSYDAWRAGRSGID